MKELNKTLNSLFPRGPNITESCLSKISRSLIVAPHPDDESLACGGTIALLRKNHYPVHVIFVTDGTMSHPNSKLFPSLKLRSLREAEAINALSILGVPTTSISFLRLPDSRLNEISRSVYQRTSEKITELITQFQPDTIFVPWRQDPHPDHIASWALLRDAIKKYSLVAIRRPVLLEYLLWFWERTNPNEIASSQTAKIWSIDITPTLQKKANAIREHKSQFGQLIKDDPGGFSLPPTLLEKLQGPNEIYLEYNDTF